MKGHHSSKFTPQQCLAVIHSLCKEQKVILQLCSHKVSGHFPSSEEVLPSTNEQLCLEATASSQFLVTCTPNVSCFLYVTRFEVLLQSALKVSIKHSQTPDFWKLRRNYLSLLPFHKCCRCSQPCQIPKHPYSCTTNRLMWSCLLDTEIRIWLIIQQDALQWWGFGGNPQGTLVGLGSDP